MPAALVDALRRQPDIEIPEMELGWEQAAYMTVSGQNSNNTVRVSDEFMKDVELDGDWHLTVRPNGALVRRVQARALWRIDRKSVVVGKSGQGRLDLGGGRII